MWSSRRIWGVLVACAFGEVFNYLTAMGSGIVFNPVRDLWAFFVSRATYLPLVSLPVWLVVGTVAIPLGGRRHAVTVAGFAAGGMSSAVAWSAWVTFLMGDGYGRAAFIAAALGVLIPLLAAWATLAWQLRDDGAPP